MLVSPEVRIIQHGVCIDNTYHRDFIEIQSFRNHLCANKNISTSGSKVANDALIGIPRTSSIKVHAGNTGIGKQLVYLLLYLLRAIASAAQIGRAAARTLRRDAVGIATIVARQLVQLAVVGQRDITVLTGGYPATLAALHDRSKTSAVLEQDGLFAPFQGFTHTSQQKRRERTNHHLAMLQVSGIHHLYLRQFNTLIALLQFHQSVFACHSVMVTLQGRRRRTQQNS